MSEVNWWLETYKLLPATLIGVSVVLIAFLQWKTAHTKVMVDLFDKRLAVYEGVLEAISLSNIDDGTGPETKNAMIRLFRARSDATFLFGDDITKLIQEIIDSMSIQRRNERRLRSNDLSEVYRNRYAEDAEKAGNLKDRLGRQFQQACIPYLRIDLKSGGNYEQFKRARMVIMLLICLLIIL